MKRVTVVKFRVDDRGSDGTGCFKIKVRTNKDSVSLTDVYWQTFYMCDYVSLLYHYETSRTYFVATCARPSWPHVHIKLLSLSYRIVSFAWTV